jgi:hypothetical protein
LVRRAANHVSAKRILTAVTFYKISEQFFVFSAKNVLEHTFESVTVG